MSSPFHIFIPRLPSRSPTLGITLVNGRCKCSVAISCECFRFEKSVIPMHTSSRSRLVPFAALTACDLNLTALVGFNSENRQMQCQMHLLLFVSDICPESPFKIALPTDLHWKLCLNIIPNRIFLHVSLVQAEHIQLLKTHADDENDPSEAVLNICLVSDSRDSISGRQLQRFDTLEKWHTYYSGHLRTNELHKNACNSICNQSTRSEKEHVLVIELKRLSFGRLAL